MAATATASSVSRRRFGVGVEIGAIVSLSAHKLRPTTALAAFVAEGSFVY